MSQAKYKVYSIIRIGKYLLLFSQEDMYVTASSATDIYYLVRKNLHSTEQAKDVMAKLYRLFHIYFS